MLILRKAIEWIWPGLAGLVQFTGVWLSPASGCKTNGGAAWFPAVFSWAWLALDADGNGTQARGWIHVNEYNQTSSFLCGLAARERQPVPPLSFLRPGAKQKIQGLYILFSSPKNFFFKIFCHIESYSRCIKALNVVKTKTNYTVCL